MSSINVVNQHHRITKSFYVKFYFVNIIESLNMIWIDQLIEI